MIRILVYAAFSVFYCFTVSFGEEYRAVFWNLHSGDSEDSFIADQVAAKTEIDFWGFSEVQNQATVSTILTALRAANPSASYRFKISEEGGGDRLAIIYRSDRLQAVPYSGLAVVDPVGHDFFEVDQINVGGTIRPALGIQLKTESGQQVIALVNHWKCCSGADEEERRLKQAIQMNAFVISSPGIPVVSGGDFNIPLHADGQDQAAFQELESMWTYLEPQDNVGSWRGGSVLDAVFISQDLDAWISSNEIIRREGDKLTASTKTFSDDDSSTDHRPLLLTIVSNPDRVEHLREKIAELEAELDLLKAELASLEN